MHGPRQARRILNAYRSWTAKRRGKRNGQLGWIDDPGLENLVSNSKRRYRRHLLVKQRPE